MHDREKVNGSWRPKIDCQKFMKVGGQRRTRVDGLKCMKLNRQKFMRANGPKCTKKRSEMVETDEKIKHGRGRYKAHESGRPKKKESGRLKQMDFRHSWVTKVYVELENFNFPDFSKLPLLPDEDMFDKIRSANGTSPSVVLIATFIFRSRANKKLSRF